MNKIDSLEKLLQDMMNESKERIGERAEKERMKCLERYFDLYYKGHISKEDLISAITE